MCVHAHLLEIISFVRIANCVQTWLTFRRVLVSLTRAFTLVCQLYVAVPASKRGGASRLGSINEVLVQVPCIAAIVQGQLMWAPCGGAMAQRQRA